jgi:hypothetical protein
MTENTGSPLVKTDTWSRTDEWGFPFVWNGKRDYGDSCANWARGYIAGVTCVWSRFLEYKTPTGFIRGPKHLDTFDDFWMNPKDFSRDQARSLNWVLMRGNAKDYYVTRAGRDIMLPFQFWTAWPLRWIRDFEILINVLICCGIFPVHRHDKPFGFGKRKMFFFSWQDRSFCDMDVNLVCDIYCSQNWFGPTFLGWISRKLYKKMRGCKPVLRYYLRKNGNNNQIGRGLARLTASF